MSTIIRSNVVLSNAELLRPHHECECDRIVKAQHDRLLKALD
jgi:hypothetical protein